MNYQVDLADADHVDHEAASGVIGTLKTNTHWAPFLMAARTTISRIGFNVVKASPKSSCSIVIHTASFGLPKTRLGGPYALSADTIGDREFAIRPPFLTLDAGLYDIGIHCSDDLVVVRGYVEQAAFAIFAAGSSQGADTSPVTGGEASAENPSIAYLSLNNEMPQIWLRR